MQMTCQISQWEKIDNNLPTISEILEPGLIFKGGGGRVRVNRSSSTITILKTFWFKTAVVAPNSNNFCMKTCAIFLVSTNPPNMQITAHPSYKHLSKYYILLMAFGWHYRANKNLRAGLWRQKIVFVQNTQIWANIYRPSKQNTANLKSNYKHVQI